MKTTTQRVIAYNTTLGVFDPNPTTFKLKKGEVITVEPPDLYARQYATIQGTRVYTYKSLIERISNPINDYVTT